MPRVRHHARPQALPHLRKNSKQQTVHGNNDGRSPALINVRPTEPGRGKQDPHRDAASPGNKLFLEISTKNDLFASARGHGCENPKKYFQMILREQVANVLAGLGRVERNRGDTQDDKSNQPETRGDGDILKESLPIVPLSPDEFAQGRAVTFGAPSDVGDDGPLQQNREDIHGRAMWIVRGTHRRVPM